MTQDAGEGETAVEAAARRLERAASVLEGRLGQLTARADVAAGGAFDDDRTRLAEALDQSHSRERELREAGQEASQALGRAIAEIRGALARSEVN